MPKTFNHAHLDTLRYLYNNPNSSTRDLLSNVARLDSRVKLQNVMDYLTSHNLITTEGGYLYKATLLGDVLLGHQEPNEGMKKRLDALGWEFPMTDAYLDDLHQKEREQALASSAKSPTVKGKPSVSSQTKNVRSNEHRLSPTVNQPLSDDAKKTAASKSTVKDGPNKAGTVVERTNKEQETVTESVVKPERSIDLPEIESDPKSVAKISKETPLLTTDDKPATLEQELQSLTTPVEDQGAVTSKSDAERTALDQENLAKGKPLSIQDNDSEKVAPKPAKKKAAIVSTRNSESRGTMNKNIADRIHLTQVERDILSALSSAPKSESALGKFVTSTMIPVPAGLKRLAQRRFITEDKKCYALTERGVQFMNGKMMTPDYQSLPPMTLTHQLLLEYVVFHPKKYASYGALIKHLSNAGIKASKEKIKELMGFFSSPGIIVWRNNNLFYLTTEGKAVLGLRTLETSHVKSLNSAYPAASDWLSFVWPGLSRANKDVADKKQSSPSKLSSTAKADAKKPISKNAKGSELTTDQDEVSGLFSVDELTDQANPVDQAIKDAATLPDKLLSPMDPIVDLDKKMILLGDLSKALGKHSDDLKEVLLSISNDLKTLDSLVKRSK